MTHQFASWSYKSRAITGRDAAVNFDTYRILPGHHAVSPPQHSFLVYIRDRLNAEITRSTLIFTAVMQLAQSTLFFGVFPLDQIADVVNVSRYLTLFGREVIFELFQAM